MAKINSPIKLALGLSFGLEGIVFFIASHLTIMKINRYFPPFYKEHKCSLYTVMFGLSLPLVFHSIFDLLDLDSDYVSFK